MGQKLEADWNQIHMLPPSVEDWIGSDHPARFIREFVGQLDLDPLGFVVPSGELGRPGYSERLLLRVWLYGYLMKIRSSRKLEHACREQMGFIWLCGGHRPDHNTLWRFWKGNHQGLRQLFKRSVQVAVNLDLVGFVTQAVDGTKIEAVSSSRGVYDKAALERLLEKLEKQIAEHEEQLQQAEHEAGASVQLPEELRQAQVLHDKVQGALEMIEQGESKHVHPQEPQARRMSTEGRNRFSYNAQAVVDAQEQIIVGADVVNEPNDAGQLNRMIDCAEETSGEVCEKTLADGGYSNGSQIEQAQGQGRDVVMPPPKAGRGKKDSAYRADKFQYDPQSDDVICPQNRRLGFQRERHRSGATIRIYRNSQACKECPVRGRCTQDRHGRSIEIAPWYEAVTAHRNKMSQDSARKTYALRAGIVEPVFAWTKNNDGMRRWSFRGLEKVRTQWAVLCTARNLRVIYRHWTATRDKTPSPSSSRLVNTIIECKMRLRSSSPHASSLLGKFSNFDTRLAA